MLAPLRVGLLFLLVCFSSFPFNAFETRAPATLQAFNGLLFVAQVISAVACLVLLIASTHRITSSDDGSVEFYWSKLSTPGSNGEPRIDTKYRDIERSTANTDAGYVADQCFGGGIALFILSLISLLLLLWNLGAGMIRVMEIPEDWLQQYLNPDLGRWIRLEASRLAAVLLALGLGLVIYGGTCVRASANTPLGSESPDHRAASKLVLTGYLYALICWFLLAFATALYWPIYNNRQTMYEGEGSRRHAREQLAHDEVSGTRAGGMAGLAQSSPRAGLAAGARRSSLDGSIDDEDDVGVLGKPNGRFTHPDSLRPTPTVSNLQTNLPPGPITLGVLHSSPKPMTPAAASAAAARVGGEDKSKLNLDHVLKMDHDHGEEQQQQQQQPHHAYPSMGTRTGAPLPPHVSTAARPRGGSTAGSSANNSRYASANATPMGGGGGGNTSAAGGGGQMQFSDISLASPAHFAPASARGGNDGAGSSGGNAAAKPGRSPHA